MVITKEVAQTAATAIDDYLSKRLRGSQLEGARVEMLEVIEGKKGTLWLAHLQPCGAGTFSAHLFEIDALGVAHPAPGHRYGQKELYPATQDIPGAPAHSHLPSTALLAQMVEAIEQRYAAFPNPLPETFRLLWPGVKARRAKSDEDYAAEMLIYLCAAIDALEIHREPSIAPLYCQAVARL